MQGQHAAMDMSSCAPQCGAEPISSHHNPQSFGDIYLGKFCGSRGCGDSPLY